MTYYDSKFSTHIIANFGIISLSQHEFQTCNSFQNSREEEDDSTSDSDALGEGEPERFHGTGMNYSFPAPNILTLGFLRDLLSLNLLEITQQLLVNKDAHQRCTLPRKLESETCYDCSWGPDDVARAPDPYPPDLVPAEGRPRRDRRVAPRKGIGGEYLCYIRCQKVLFIGPPKKGS